MYLYLGFVVLLGVGGAEALELRFDENAHGEAWLELTSLEPRGEAKRVFLEPGERSTAMDVEPGRAMLCVGGEEIATRCEQVDVEPGTALALPSGEGVDLVGRFVQGKDTVAAQVRLAPADLQARVPFTLPLGRDGQKLVREVTSEAGEFRVPRLAPGSYLLEAELASGRIYRSDEIVVPEPEELRGRNDDLQQPTILDLGEIFIEPGLALEFLVTDDGGEPLAGATVGYSQRTAPLAFKSFRATTDADGRATLSGIDPELPGQVTCRAPGHRTDRREHELPPIFVECALERLAQLAGAVVDTDGAPLATATVSVSSVTEPSEGKHSNSDDEGRFSFPELPAGGHRLVVAAPGFGAEQRTIELLPGEERTLGKIALAPGRELWAVLVDAESGEPVAGAEATILDPAGGGSGVSDGEGELRLTTDSSSHLVLRVDSDRYATRTVELPLEELDAEEPFRIELSAGGFLRVEVYDPETGLPCTGCRVAVDGGRELVTDRDGRAFSPALEPGSYRVHLVHLQSRGSLLTVEGGRDQRRAEVRSRETTTVRFGDPREEIEIAFDRPVPPGWELLVADTSLATFRPGPDGTVQLRRRPGEVAELFLTETATALGRTIRLRPLAPADGPRVEIELPRTRVAGRLFENEGPVAGRQVALRALVDARSYARAITDADGRFALPFVAPGSYALVVDGRQLRLLSVTEGTSGTPIEIQLPPG